MGTTTTTTATTTMKKVITHNNIKVESGDFSSANRTQNTSHLGGGNIVAAKSGHSLSGHAPRKRRRRGERLQGTGSARAYN